MILTCKNCNDHGEHLEIVDAWEQTNEHGSVVKFRETYQCGLCEQKGTLHADSTKGTDDQRLTGILGMKRITRGYQ